MSKFSIPYRSVSKRLITRIPQWLSPNHLVYLGFLLFLIFPGLLFFELKIASILILLLVVLLDHLDGDLARYRNQTSVYGAKIDNISDRLRGLILALSVGFILLGDYHVIRFIPVILFFINEIMIPFLRPNLEQYSFKTKLIYNLDMLGWVPFSYIYPFLVLSPIPCLYYFYVICSIYIVIKVLLTLALKFDQRSSGMN